MHIPCDFFLFLSSVRYATLGFGVQRQFLIGA